MSTLKNRHTCKVRIKVSLGLGLLFIVINLHAQHYVPLDYNTGQMVEREVVKSEDLIFSTSFKPFYINTMPQGLNFDSLLLSLHQHIISEDRSWAFRKLRYENLFVVDKKDFYVTLDPIFILDLGQEKNNDETLYRNTRGIIINGRLGKKLTFTTSIYENQAVFPTYINEFVYDYEVIPGQAYPKAYGDSTYFDFSWANGSFAYTPWKWLSLQFGQGKIFIGNGYRSLLYSDNSYNYPYLLLKFKFSKFEYYLGYASLMDLRYPNTVFRGFEKKTNIMHYLTWKPVDQLELSLFESTMCDNPDSAGKFTLDWQLVNPLILLNSFDDSHTNSITGLNFNYSLFKTAQLYGQVFCTQWDFNRSGFQAGVKYFDALGIPNLFLQTEYNQATPYSYTDSNSRLAHAHYNQPLASPLGANFKESLSKLNYRYRSWQVEVQYNYAKTGTDSTGSNVGHNVLFPYENKSGTMLQGLKTTTNIINLNLSYIINPKTNFLFTLGYTYRDVHSEWNPNRTSVVYISLHHRLNNFYYDF